MNNERKKIVAGNWKMNGTVNSLDQIRQLRKLIKNDSSDIIVCPPTTLLSQAINIVKDSEIVIGSQNCHENNSGAHTGEISAQMLSDIGVKVVILGHSERRANNFESSELIKKKSKNFTSSKPDNNNMYWRK
jgi:triosephosphate isomerase